MVLGCIGFSQIRWQALILVFIPARDYQGKEINPFRYFCRKS